MSATVLWIVAAILVIVGIVQLIQGQIILGIVLIVVGCVVGPGGYSIFRSRRVNTLGGRRLDAPSSALRPPPTSLPP